MLETISRLETTERTEAYGYLQNCVNVLGVHKLGLNRKLSFSCRRYISNVSFAFNLELFLIYRF